MTKTKETIKSILSWLFGVFFILGGLGTLFSQLIPGLSLMLGGLILIPPVGRLLKAKFKIDLNVKSKALVFGIAIVIFGISAEKMPETEPANSSTENEEVAMEEKTIDVAEEIEEGLEVPVEMVIAEVNQELEVSERKTLGISYDEMMNYLSNFFVMEETPALDDGRNHYLGQSSSQLAILEIIGDKNDIDETAVIVFLPNDNPAAIIENTAISIRFVKNAVPGWPEGGAWLNKALEDIDTDSDGKIETTYDGKAISALFTPELGMLSLTVSPE